MGIGRLVFIGCSFGLWFVLIAAIKLGVHLGYDELGLMAVGTLYFPVLIVAVYLRLKNLGSNPVWCILTIVPLINLLVLAPCVVSPEGYNITKKLDTAGKIMVSFGAILFLLIILLMLG